MMEEQILFRNQVGESSVENLRKLSCRENFLVFKNIFLHNSDKTSKTGTKVRKREGGEGGGGTYIITRRKRRKCVLNIFDITTIK